METIKSKNRILFFAPYFFIFLLLQLHTITRAQTIRMPLKETVENSAMYRWQHKQILDSLVFDNVEDSVNWKHDDFGTMKFTTERVRDGKYSIRLHSKTKGDKPTADNRTWGYCSAIRPVANENWTRWNRLSVWIYPDAPGHKNVDVYILVVNDKGKNRSRDNIILKNQQWNHVITEIEFLPKDKVTAVEIRCRLTGNEPGTSDTFTYYVDHVVLESTVPDHYKGWNCAPGKIAYSHTGYSVGGEKAALSSDLKAENFSIVNSFTDKVVFTKPVTKQKTYRGDFQILEFSDFDEPGTYYIKAGDRKTENFRIDSHIWQQPLEKALNFYYVLRTGVAIPGVHDASTTDWHATNGKKSVSLTGGWYDAGDLSQGLNNNSEATLFMFQAAERLIKNKESPELAARLTEEGTWGLDWMLKTTLHDGLRPLWAVQCWWSNGIVGDNDDPSAGFGKSTTEFMKAAAAEAIGYRILKDKDPVRAAQSLKTAEEDYGFALTGLEKDLKSTPACSAAASTIIAGLELYKATGKKEYSEKALSLAPMLVAAQERSYIPGSKEITGFLYEKADKQKTMHISGGWDVHDHNQILAMASLCEMFPDNPEWMEWYSAIALYADLNKKIIYNTAPYKLVPAGIYKNDEYLKAADKEKMHQQLLSGEPIGETHVLRALLANDGHFGSLHYVLSQAISISTAASLRNDAEAAHMAERQLEWTLGLNPFCRSLMYGEGYDYIPQYSPMCGNIVGALPTGMPTFGAIDEPYWPAGGNEPAPKESWVQTEQMFIKLAGQLLGPSLITGKAEKDVQITNMRSGTVIKLTPGKNGDFRTSLPQGSYKIVIDGITHELDVVPASNYHLSNDLSFSAAASIDSDGQVKIDVTSSGRGKHSFEVRTSNLILVEKNRSVNLKPGTSKHLIWTGKTETANSPWYAVIVPDGDISQRREVKIK